MKPSESQPGLVIETPTDVSRVSDALAAAGYEADLHFEIGTELDEVTSRLAISGLYREAQSLDRTAALKALKHPIRYIRNTEDYRSRTEYKHFQATEKIDRAHVWEQHLEASFESEVAKTR